MQIPCEVLISKDNGKFKLKRPARAFLMLKKCSSTNKDKAMYVIEIKVQNNQNNNKFAIPPLPKIISTNITMGKLTMTFPTNPTSTVFVSKAKFELLKQFLDNLVVISKGENLSLDKIKVVSSDFKPRRIEIKSRGEYQNTSKKFSQFLEQLVIGPIGLVKADRRWALCTNLSELFMPNNNVGENWEDLLVVVTRLKNLRVLDLTNCSLNKISIGKQTKIFRSLANSLTSLSIGSNELNIFPTIWHLHNLLNLDCSINNITEIPTRISSLQNLQTFFINDNPISSIPNNLITNGRKLERLNVSRTYIFSNEIQVPRKTKIIENMAFNYSWSSGVDKLSTLCAHIIHKNRFLLNFAQQILPWDLRLTSMDYLNDECWMTSLGVCSKCRGLRHIRDEMIFKAPLTNFATTLDSVNASIYVKSSFCKDCRI